MRMVISKMKLTTLEDTLQNIKETGRRLVNAQPLGISTRKKELLSSQIFFFFVLLKNLQLEISFVVFSILFVMNILI